MGYTGPDTLACDVQTIAALRKEVGMLQQEVQARNVVVGNKEARIYDLKLKARPRVDNLVDEQPVD